MDNLIFILCLGVAIVVWVLYERSQYEAEDYEELSERDPEFYKEIFLALYDVSNGEKSYSPYDSEYISGLGLNPRQFKQAMINLIREGLVEVHPEDKKKLDEPGIKRSKSTNLRFCLTHKGYDWGTFFSRGGGSNAVSQTSNYIFNDIKISINHLESLVVSEIQKNTDHEEQLNLILKELKLIREGIQPTFSREVSEIITSIGAGLITNGLYESLKNIM